MKIPWVMSVYRYSVKHGRVNRDVNGCMHTIYVCMYSQLAIDTIEAHG